MPAQAVDRVPSGSAADYLLAAERTDALVPAALALRERHVSAKAAKQTIDRLASGERVALRVPAVEDEAAFESVLLGHGVRARRVRVPEEIDVAAIRRRLGLSQDEFARRFGLDAGTLRGWEQGRHRPDPPARVLLAVIERAPEQVDEAVAPLPS